jgi:hypothetical protein
LGKLANLSRDGSGRRKDGGFQLRGEKEAHLGKLLGEKISRISALLGADPACLSKLLDEISSPTSRAETSIEASASVTRLTSPPYDSREIMRACRQITAINRTA